MSKRQRQRRASGTDELTPKEARFVESYIVSLHATKAYQEAFGVKPATARTNASRLLTTPRIEVAIARALEERAKRTQITADDVLRMWWSIATADPRELTEVRVGCCRYCHGNNHDYQHTRLELARKKKAWSATHTDPSTATFDEEGGDKFDVKRAPHPRCPECFGEGVRRVVVHDTRTLSRGAALLFDGVKETGSGLEVLRRGRDAALENVAKHLGMFRDPGEPASMTDDERARKIRAELEEMDRVTVPAA